MDIEFESVSCNLCGSNDYEIFLTREDLNTFLEGSFQLVRCNRCGLVYQNPRPSSRSWDVIYPEEYDQYTCLSDQEFYRNAIYRYGFQKRLRSIEKFKLGGNLCDIGCATGDFLREVQLHSNWRVFGIEPSPYASNLAQKAGLSIHNGTLFDAPFPNVNFDVFTMWNVIEHLEDPKKNLQEIYNRLNPSGLLVFTTPNLESIDARLFGKYWIGYELPRHFYIFSKTSLFQYLKETGFDILSTQCLYGEHAAAMSSLQFWLRAKYPHLRKRSDKVLFSLPVRILLAPIISILNIFEKSSPLTIIAQKRH